MKNLTKIVILSVMLVFSIFADTKNVFKMGVGSKTIKESTSCRPSKWLGVENDSCVCCVLKNTPKGTMTDAVEVKTLNACLKYCTGPVLSSLSKQLDFKSPGGTSPNKGLVPLIIKNFAGLQPIDMSSADLDSDGNLKETSTADAKLSKSVSNPSSLVFLQKALDLSDADSRNFTVVKLGGGGAQTLQLFLIKDKDGPKYILKGMKKPEEEVKNLEIIRNSQLKKYLLDPKNIKRETPALAMDVNNFAYVDKKGTVHSMSLIDLAAGNEVAKIIMDWTNNPKDTTKKERATKALYRLGNNISLIHKDFMAPMGKIFGKTYVHGDMHPYNIFYDDKNDRIIFIDNESFALSIASPKDPSIDIMKLFGRLVATSHAKRHSYMKKDTSKNDYYDTVVKPFVLGYVDAYQPNDQQAVFAMLYQIMTKQGALETFMDNKKSFVNPIDLAMSRDLTKTVFKSIARDFPNLKYPGSN